MTDHTALKEAAEAATPGPWVAKDKIEVVNGLRSWWFEITQNDEYGQSLVHIQARENMEENAAFIALANPSKVLELLAENEALREDKARLDFLDEANARLNEQAGSKYGWELIFNHNVNRLMTKQGHLSVDLNDAKAHGHKSCRDAIDLKMKDVALRRARALTEKQS
jgi:hypothetical protein